MLVALNGEYGAFYDIVKIKRNGSTIRDVPKSVERVSMEESSSTNSIRDNAENVKENGQNSEIRFSLMNNGIIAIELNTVKDINSKNTKYNLVVSAFSVKDNYVRNLLQKRADSVEYTKKDLSQLKPQLYEWLASVNERSNGSSQVNHQLHESLAIINEKSDGFGKQLRNNSTTASSEVLNEGISRSNSPKREGVEPISSNGNTSTARAAGTADGSSSASDGDVSTNSIRDNTENVKRNGQKSDTPDARYSLSAVDDYTEKQYNDYGWVRVNDVLSDREYADFNRKMNNLSAEIRRGKTASGEYIIPVNDMQGERFGVNNVLVFAKGTYQNPKITRVIRIGLDNETSIEIIRRDIYEWEATARQESAFYQSLYGTSLISEVTPASCRSYQESKIEWRRRGSGSESGGIDGFDREIQDGRGDSRSDQRDVRYSVSQSRDENYVNNRLKSYTYSDSAALLE